MNDFQLFMIVVAGIIISLGVGIGFYIIRKRLRHAKDVERSLKMVPLLLKLPPPERDTGDSRDERDEIKENIARAESIYKLLSGIATNRRIIYSQRHIAFEIVAQGEQIYFYVVVPAALLTAVEKALVSSYPTLQIARVSDHNIFSQTGKSAALAGGEFKLTEKSYYPIHSFKTLDTDPLGGVIASLSRLAPDEGAAIQMLIRPASPQWERKARTTAKGLLNPNEKRSTDPTKMILEVAKAPWQAPNHDKDDPSKKMKQADSIDQKLAQAIEEKASEPAFETMIRVVASTAELSRSKMIMQDIINGFAQFSLPGSNSLMFKEAKTPQKLARDFIFRFFDAKKKKLVLTVSELATIYHLPDQGSTLAAPVERKGMKEVAAPADLPKEGLIIGSNFYRGKENIVRLTDRDRTRHMYIVGQTGTGKSVTLEDLIVQDMASGKGICVIDPHGELADSVLAKVPRSRVEDVVYFNPADAGMPLGLNILEFDPAHPEQKDFVIQETINMLYKLYDPDQQGIIGPRFEHWYRQAALTVMSDPDGATFLEVPKPFIDDEFLKEKFKFVKDPTVQDFWINEMGQTSDYHKSEMLGWFVSKWGAFSSNEIMRNIIGQKHSAFNFTEIMDTNKILIVNLSKGLVGEGNSKLLGMMFVIKLLASALARSGRPKNQMPQFTVYVDEFQNFSTDSFATILSEARKYNLCLIVANQFIGQLSEQIKGAVFGNVGTLMSFRCGAEDAEYLAKQFEPSFDEADLINMPNINAAIKLMAKDTPTVPFTIKPIFPPPGEPNAQAALAMKELSRSKYGRPKAEVDAEVKDILQTRTSKPIGPEPAKIG
ncbi:type IV secretion system DNA-binding domain-containing protein [Candidatus Saccharibacteria bacterium]|nr:type IV secretion system DNA-binding domain-containing protein [Candidatus Saccharibacteria bacterium]